MTCSEFNSNNRPLGAGYDSRNHPRSLVELTSINVSSVTATSGITTSQITPSTGNGGDLIVNGRIVAQAIIGSGNYFSALGDVQPALTMTPGSIVTINNSSQLSVSSPSSVLDSLYLRTGGTAQTVNNLSPGSNQYIYWNGGGTAQLGSIYTQGVQLLNAATPSQVQSILDYATTFAELNDAFNPVVVGAGRVVVTNATGLASVASSVFVGGGGGGGGASSLSALNDVTVTTPVTNQLLYWNGTKWANGQPIGFYSLADVDATSLPVNDVTKLQGSVIEWNSSNEKWEAINASGWIGTYQNFVDHGSIAGLADNDHPQYTLSSTNSNLSSLVNNHIASASVHFTSGSLSGYYAASSWVNTNFVSTSTYNTFTGTTLPGTYLTQANAATAYVPQSGGTFTNNFVFGGVSATTISATNYSGISFSGSLKDVQIGSVASNDIPGWNSTTGKWVNNTVAQTRGNLSLSGPASSLVYFSAANATASASLTPFARTILDDTTAAEVRGTIGVSGAANSLLYFNLANTPAQATIQNTSLSILNNLFGAESLILSDGVGGFGEVTYADQSILRGDSAGSPSWLVATNPNDLLFFDGNNVNWLAGGSAGVVLAIDNAGTMAWVASSTFAGGGGGTPGGSESNVQYKSGSSFAGNAGFTYIASTQTVSGTNIKFNNASGAVVSATTVSAGVLHIGGSDGFIRNNNGSIYISATNGQVIFPLGLSSTSAVMPGFTVSGGGVTIGTLVADFVTANTTLTANSVSATTYNNIPYNHGLTYLMSRSLF